MDPIVDKLRKIQALAESGAAGEREAAAGRLAELCAKHGVTLDQLLAEEARWCNFYFSGEVERRLLVQCAVFVCRSQKITNGQRKGKRNEWSFKLTRAQEIDLREVYAHYRAAWEKHLAEAFEAFVHANRIYGPKSADVSRDELSADELARLRRLVGMAGMIAPSPLNRHLRLTS